MSEWQGTRRDFGKTIGFGAAVLAAGSLPALAQEARPEGPDEKFFVRPEELTLHGLRAPGARELSFAKHKGDLEAWRKACRAKLAELLGFQPPSAGRVERRRTITHEDVQIEAWVMQVNKDLSIPAYLLIPKSKPPEGRAVMAIHGHGRAEPCVGQRDDYHHYFALRLAQAGHLVLCPELRGFGALADMTFSDENRWLNYWGGRRYGHFTLVTDGLLHGRTLIAETIEDLLRWENWLAETRNIKVFDVPGISYGGDLVITYPAFSERVGKMYCSGSMGSFAPIFVRCCNAPAHCVPSVLQWMDRSDIAGLNAPRPIRLHYGELDVPGPDNGSASYNETVEPALAELRTIYHAFGAEDKVSMHVSKGRRHEFEIPDLLEFLAPDQA